MTQPNTLNRLSPHFGEPVLEARKVVKGFNLPGGGQLRVLSEINFSLFEGEIVALLGKSGSGKSTLLRILAGLIPASQGQVFYRGRPLAGSNTGVAMVFQSFALLPWLTVQQNVELGLEAKGTPRAERRKLALEAIDLIGLDGFERAYPKELSGGMRQRVGFARALVVRPDALFMDEPFSALDVLTAENLRNEIIDLWVEKKFPARSILIVTHNIEEAVYLADRIVVLGSNPGVVRAVFKVDLPHSRERKSPEFTTLVDQIYQVMTNPEVEVEDLLARYQAAVQDQVQPPGSQSGEEMIERGDEEEENDRHIARVAEAFLSQTTEQAQGLRLPQAKVGGMAGLLELLEDQGGEADIFALAKFLNFEVDDLLPITDALDLLDLADVKSGDLKINEQGRAFVTGDIQERKALFRTQLIQRVPLVDSIHRALTLKKDRRLPADFFIDILDQRFSPDEAGRQLETAIDWGRYAELFEYDAAQEQLFIPSGDLE